MPNDEIQEIEESRPAEGETSAETGDAVDRSEFEKVLAERDRYLELAKRVQADFENYQKRASRDLQTERRYAAKPLAQDLIPVLDNLDRALAAARGKTDPAPLVEGIEMVRRQFLDALKNHGVEAIQADGETFDPNQHEALMQQPCDEVEPMTVLHTVQAGYRLHDRIIRPAHVIVACPLVDGEEGAEDSSDDSAPEAEDEPSQEN